MSGFCVLVLRQVQEEAAMELIMARSQGLGENKLLKYRAFLSFSRKIIFPAVSKSVGQITYARLQAATGYFTNSKCTAYCISVIFFCFSTG